jgi:hypothetical protein
MERQVCLLMRMASFSQATGVGGLVQLGWCGQKRICALPIIDRANREAFGLRQASPHDENAGR